MFPYTHSPLILPDRYEIEFFCGNLSDISICNGCVLDKYGYGFVIIPNDKHFNVRVTYK